MCARMKGDAPCKVVKWNMTTFYNGITYMFYYDIIECVYIVQVVYT